MTDDIDTMTGPELSAAVAVEVMGWHLGKMHTDNDWWFSANENGVCPEFPACQWQPYNDRNQLAMVVGELTDVQSKIFDLLSGRYLLTCDPAIICRAALRAFRESKP